MNSKKIPMRKCVATQTALPKKEMFRIVRTPEKEVKVDPVGKMNGRGAYLAKTEKAILLAKKKNSLGKHLEIAIPEHIYDELLNLVNNE